jgi:phosphoribosylaminoimidazole carboxylase (NCAIR synthetase)
VSHHHIQTGYLDEQGLAELASRCAAITTEFENVPAPALFTLGQHRPVAPAADRRGHRPGPRSRRKPISCAAACPWRPMP